MDALTILTSENYRAMSREADLCIYPLGKGTAVTGLTIIVEGNFATPPWAVFCVPETAVDEELAYVGLTVGGFDKDGFSFNILREPGVETLEVAVERLAVFLAAYRANPENFPILR